VLKKVRTKGCLSGMRMWDVVCFLCNLSVLVPELGIQWSSSRKSTLRDNVVGRFEGIL
jgi:hypothetical protein